MNFEVNLVFLIKLFFLHEQKVMRKTQVSRERKVLWRWNKKYFSSSLKSFQWSKQYKLFSEGESPTLVLEVRFGDDPLETH